ncbi:E3 ubiquitin-protein ligase RNF8 isoform X2 [Procambarus clarkii]|uniref:E3 ubiquitin-protein ligase RNF8 isoform X2 n=1 Tax=Procambarus clarkii TaxID=6728 RepID=UPI0037431EA1
MSTCHELQKMGTQRLFYLKRLPPNDGQYDVIPFKEDEVLIGRTIDAAYKILDKLISRKHALFRRKLDHWTVTNLSLNGVYVNGEAIAKETEHDLSVGDTVQLGQPASFVYRFGMKVIGARPGNTSQDCSIKRIKSERERSSVQVNLSQEHAILEQQLKESDALQARLQQERDQLRTSLHQQHEQLQEKYQHEREQLEMQFAAGALAQQVMLEEKEALAKNLEMQVTQLQGRLDDERKTLEERARKEEEQRNRILQEKESVLHRLEKEKANLELKLEEERKRLQDQLKATESHKEELRQQVQEKESAIRAKEAEQKQAEQEKQKLKDELAQERCNLMRELESVKNALAEKEHTNALLGSELKDKEEELRSKLSSLERGMQERVTAEVEKSTAVVHEKAMKDLQQVLEDKSRLQEELHHAQAHDHEQLASLHEALQMLEAQKMSLEQELASTAVASEHARKEVVESVSDVLENEFQCPICNELFITAIMLNCSHTFCRYCIDQWKKNKKECPNCRAPITSETRSLVVDNFIEKIVPTLSEEMKRRRAEIVAERKAVVEAASLAQAQAAAAAAAAPRGRGRRGGRGRNRNGWGGHVHPDNVSTNRPPVDAHHVERRRMPVSRNEPLRPVQNVSGPLARNETSSGSRRSSSSHRAEVSRAYTDNYIHDRYWRPPTSRRHFPGNSGLGTPEDPIVVGSNE